LRYIARPAGTCIMDPIRKQDWGGRWGWALKTEVLNRNFFLTPGLIL